VVVVVRVGRRVGVSARDKSSAVVGEGDVAHRRRVPHVCAKALARVEDVPNLDLVRGRARAGGKG